MLELEITLVCLFTRLCAQFSLPNPFRLCMSSPVLPSPLSLSVLWLPPLISSHSFVHFSVRAHFSRFLLVARAAWCFPMGVTALLRAASAALQSLPSVKLVVSKLAKGLVNCVLSSRSLSPPADGFHFLFPHPCCYSHPFIVCVCVWDSVNNQVLNWFKMVYTAVDLTLWELSDLYQQRLSVFRYPIKDTPRFLGFKENLRKPPLKLSELYRKRRRSRATCFPATKLMSILHFKALYGRIRVYPDHYCLVLIARL